MIVSIVATGRIGEFTSEIRALPPAAKHAWRARNNRGAERVTICLTQYAHLRLRGFAADVRRDFVHAVLHPSPALPISESASPATVCAEADTC